MAIQGIVTLDGEEIGTFDMNYREEIVVVLHKVSHSFEDVLELATENGMTVALALKLDFNDHIPQHSKGLDTLP